MDRALIDQLERRTLVSLFRTLCYVTIAACVALGHVDVAHLLNGVVIGAVFADWMTWIARSLTQLPQNLAHRAYEAVVNFAFAAWYFHRADFHIDGDGNGLFGALVAFMFVLGVKAAYYSLMDIHAQLAAD